MKNLIVAALAAAVISTAAFATDLPNKNAAPEFPVEVGAGYVAQNIITGSFTSNFEPGEYSDSTGFDYTLDYKFTGLGNGIAVGGSIVSSSTSNFEDFDARRLEADVTWAAPSGFGITTNIGGGLGYRLNEEDVYYQVNSGIDYSVNDFVTLNAINYRFRNNLDNNWQSHEVGTGVTITVVDNVSVSGKIARSYDEDVEAASDSFTVGVGFEF